VAELIADRANRDTLRWTDEELANAVTDFVRDYSIEATPHAAGGVDSYRNYLAPGTTVYVAHPPRATLTEVVELACRLQNMGYRTVPHIAVRRIESEQLLTRALATLRDADVHQALVIGGDLAKPVGPYESALQVLETGLLASHEFHAVGLAGHPEGSRAVGPITLRAALKDKVQFASETGLRPYIVTQFGFNPDAVIDWEAATAATGVDVPIHVGMAGLVPLKELLRYAVRCGISASMRMLLSKTSALADQIKLTSVDELVLAFALHRLRHPETRMSRAHFFAFGGVAQTATWLSQLQAGAFAIDIAQRRIRVDA